MLSRLTPILIIALIALAAWTLLRRGEFPGLPDEASAPAAELAVDPGGIVWANWLEGDVEGVPEEPDPAGESPEGRRLLEAMPLLRENYEGCSVVIAPPGGQHGE